MRKFVIAVTLAAFVSACASSPGDISAQYVSPLQYQSYSCQQLGFESQRIGSRVASVTGQQQSKATSDAVAFGVGMLVFWPALFFMANGADKKEELSLLKGEYDAVQQAGIQKDCMGQSQSASRDWTPSPTSHSAREAAAAEYAAN